MCDLKVQLQAILDSCNSLFQIAGVTQADTLLDLPTSIAEVMSLNQSFNSEPEPSNEEPGGEENEGV